MFFEFRIKKVSTEVSVVTIVIMLHRGFFFLKEV